MTDQPGHERPGDEIPHQEEIEEVIEEHSIVTIAELVAPETAVVIANVPENSYIVAYTFGNKIAWDQGEVISFDWVDDNSSLAADDVSSSNNSSALDVNSGGELRLSLLDDNDDPYEGDAPTTGHTYIKLIILTPPS